MVEIWFSSDHHLHHERIIGYTGRPFTNAKEMEEALVTYHNELVKPQDHWYCLGDFSILRSKRDWPTIATSGRKFNGHKRIILGNHDHCPVEVYVNAGFEKVRGIWNGIDGLMLSHVPIHPRSLGFRFRANVHGHTHEKPEFDTVISKHDEDGQPTIVRAKPYINVCVENTDYRPINLEEVNARIQRKVLDALTLQDPKP